MRILLALLALSLPAAAAQSQAAPPWRLLAFPNAALMVQQSFVGGLVSLDQVIACEGGAKTVTFRDYHRREAPLPAGSERGCDIQCRTQMTLSDTDGPKPGGYTQRKVAWADALDLMPAGAENFTAAFAKACGAAKLVTAGGARQLLDPGTATAWRPLDTPWQLLPRGSAPAGLPRTFTVPGAAWLYAAQSAPFKASAPAVLRLRVQAQSGKIGVSLAGPGGGALASGEHAIVPDDEQIVFLRIKPGAPQVILLRNYGFDGPPGQLTVLAADVLSEAALSGQERAQLQAIAK